MTSSRDWRVLFEDLLQRGGEGGGIYAVTILARCSGARELERRFMQVAKTREQQAAQELFTSRCASFAADEVTLERALRLPRDPRLKDDPLLALATQDATRPGGAQAERRLVERYLELQDPLLLERLAGRFGQAEAGPLNFDGERYDQAHASEVLRRAWLAAACAAAAGGCGGLGDPLVNESCAIHGQCFASRRELMAAQLAAAYGDEQVRLFDTVYPRMLDVIRQRRTDAFF